MGGFGSGRLAQHVTCEASLNLDLASPATRSALKPNARTRGCWRWSSHDREIASVGYEWSSKDARLTLVYNCSGTPVRQIVTLACSSPHYGGERWWFCCPFTGRRVRALFLPPGARLWGSRHAYNLTYQSCRASGEDRAILRLLTLSKPRADAAAFEAAVLAARDPFGFHEERRWERREAARGRRNEVRRVARRHRTTPTA